MGGQAASPFGGLHTTYYGLGDDLSGVGTDQIDIGLLRPRSQRKEGIPVRLLIHRMRACDPLPADPLDPNSEEARRRYVEGEFAEFIEH